MKVLGNYQQNGAYYPGKLSKVKGDKCTILYDDGDEEINVPTSRLLFMSLQTIKRLRTGAHVLVLDTGAVRYNIGIVKRQQKRDVMVEMLGKNARTETVPRRNVTVGELG